MRVESLVLRNFRGISELEVGFEPGVNLLVGVNGAGKTAILDCLALLLRRLVDGLRGEHERAELLREDDILIGAPAAVCEITVSDEGGSRWSWSDARARQPFEPPALDDTGLSELVRRTRASLGKEPSASLPLIVHYPVNRAVLRMPERVRTRHDFEALNVYDGAFEGGVENFKLFFEWFRLREDIENESLRDAPLLHRADRQLEAVRRAIPSFLEGFSNLRIRRVPPPQRMTVMKEGAELSVGQLSDGEKCTLALVGDLARRLAIANPGLEDPLQGSGIAMIDEIDLHLHPSWQRKVVPALERTFPNCQIVLTTHSPQIVAHVRSRNIRALRREAGVWTCTTPGESFGMDSNRVLTELMGVDERPHEVKLRMEHVFTLLGEGKLTAAREAIASLQSDIGADPEMVKAETMIRRKELLGR